jgi:hypothetical protein
MKYHRAGDPPRQLLRRIVATAAVLLELLFADVCLLWRVARVNLYLLRSRLCVRGVWRLRRREQAVAGKHSYRD